MAEGFRTNELCDEEDGEIFDDMDMWILPWTCQHCLHANVVSAALNLVQPW